MPSTSLCDVCMQDIVHTDRKGRMNTENYKMCMFKLWLSSHIPSWKFLTKVTELCLHWFNRPENILSWSIHGKSVSVQYRRHVTNNVLFYVETRLKVIHLIVKYLKIQNYEVQTIVNASVVNGYCLIRKCKLTCYRYVLFSIRVILSHIVFAWNFLLGNIIPSNGELTPTVDDV
jgi:hypothetical protein